MLSVVAVVMPYVWIEWAHSRVGLGDFPAAPIAVYLARSSSALYALHGLFLLFISREVVRYAPLIRFMGLTAVGHGLLVMLIDTWAGLPLWWILLEGPAFSLTGIVILTVQTKCLPTDAEAGYR